MDLFEINGVRIDLNHPLISESDTAAFKNSSFERTEMRLVTSLLGEGHRALEIGTCTGYIAMLAAKRIGPANIRCFEANPNAVELAKRHFELNNLPITITHCVLAARAALPDLPAKVPFFIAGALVSSSLQPGGNRKGVDVDVRCLEDEIEKHQANFLIVDIEGGEVELLGKADLAPINGIIMEVHYRKAGIRPVDRMIKKLYDEGFRIDLRRSAGETLFLRREGHGDEG